MADAGKPTIVVASHKAVNRHDAEGLEQDLAQRHPEFNIIVVERSTGVAVIPASQSADADAPAPVFESTRSVDLSVDTH